MNFDGVLLTVNTFGWFQVMIIFLLVVPRFILPCHFLLNNFIAAVPSHHCNITALDDGDIFENLTREQRLAVSIPAQEDGTLSSCEMFPQPQLHQHLHFHNSYGAMTTVFFAGVMLGGMVFGILCDRQNGLGYVSCIGRLGVSMAPLMLLLEDVWRPLPQVIFCSAAITSSLVAWLLPETLNACLPETIKDIEARKNMVDLPDQEKAEKHLKSLNSDGNEN